MPYSSARPDLYVPPAASAPVDGLATGVNKDDETVEEHAVNFTNRPTPRAETLSCRISGFYPFPESTRRDDGLCGILGWAFKDTHQAITVRSSLPGGGRLMMDFMTAGGIAHPVWWDERVKWRVWLGGTIQGEVRIRMHGEQTRGLRKVRALAEAYGDSMSLYASNCRIFCARMERQVVRVNANARDERFRERMDAQKKKSQERGGLHAARLALRERRWQQMRARQDRAADWKQGLTCFRSGALPLAYPTGVALLCWDAIKAL